MRITDPNYPIIFDRTEGELQWNLLFCIVVAGKKASVQVRLLNNFLKSCSDGNSHLPFDVIREMDAAGKLESELQESRLGQYTRLACCFRELIKSNLNLSTCTVEDLESIHGIGPKTARFFMTCNRANARHAVLDTHLLKFMNQYLKMKVPSTTPGSKKEYTRLEKEWLNHVDSTGLNPAELDLAVWKIYANRDDSDYKRLMNNSSLIVLA